LNLQIVGVAAPEIRDEAEAWMDSERERIIAEADAAAGEPEEEGRK